MRLEEVLVRGNVCGIALDVQAVEVAAYGGFAGRDDLAAVYVDGEARLGGVVGNADNAIAILEEVFEDGELGLSWS